MKKTLLLPLFSILLVFSGTCEDFIVSYLNGDAFLLTRGDEEYLDIGDPVSDKARILIEEGGILELRRDSRSFTLAGPGTFELASMLARAGKRESAPLANLLSSRIDRMLSNSEIEKPSSVMGVRGAAAEEMEMDWIGSESDPYISRGRDQLREGDYSAAQKTFSQGLEIARDYGESDSEAELAFLLSWTLSVEGSTGPALHSLSLLQVDPYTPWYPEYRLLHARLLLDSGASEQAAEILRQNRGIQPLQKEDELILGIALFEGSGKNRKEALEILNGLAAENGAVADIARAYLQK